MKRRAMFVVLAIVAALCIAGAATFAVRKVQSSTARAADCSRIQAGRVNGGAIKVSDGSPRVAILGDSYVYGDWLDSPDQGWSRLVSKAKGWETYADGVSGTGFTNGGACGTDAYSSRVAEVLATKPDTVIIEGGLNDSAANPNDVRKAADSTLAGLSSVPSVVVIGPVNAPSKKGLDAIDSALRTAAAENGRQYVSALGWDLEYVPDNLHLTPAGHATYAKLAAEAIAGAVR